MMSLNELITKWKDINGLAFNKEVVLNALDEFKENGFQVANACKKEDDGECSVLVYKVVAENPTLKVVELARIGRVRAEYCLEWVNLIRGRVQLIRTEPGVSGAALEQMLEGVG